MNRDDLRETVAEEFGYQLRTTASHFRSAGKHGTDPRPEFIADHIDYGTERVMYAIAAREAAIRADERQKVLAEIERSLLDASSESSFEDAAEYTEGLLEAAYIVGRLAASTDSKGDEQ